MYWKAYSLYKLGRKPDAQTVLADLEKQFPQSRWLNDARALAAEVRASTGQPSSPESESDEELKLLAMNSLMQQDADRAIPLLEKVLADPKNSPNLKGRVIFVLAQSKSPKARQIVMQYAKGGTNPDAQLRAIEYLGTFRSDESSQTLGEVYAATTDPVVKRTVIRGLMVARAKDRLVQIAKSDPDVNMRREAIQYLGGMQSEVELADLYKTESSVELKRNIIQSLFARQAAKQLVDLARTETNVDLKREIVRMLTMIKSKDAADYLEDLIKK
jgi:HEAT repeat protein